MRLVRCTQPHLSADHIQKVFHWNKFRQERLSSPDALAAFEEGYAQARERADGQNEALFMKLDEYVAAVTDFEEKAGS